MTNPRNSARRRIIRLVVVLLSLLFGAAAAEAVARWGFGLKPARLIVSSHPWLELKPEGLRLIPDPGRVITARINGRNLLLAINTLGFRGPELASPQPEEKFRILFLGDSIVFGPGLADNETIPARLGRRLGPGIEVINAGVPGMSMKDEVDLLAEKAGAVDPDLVIVGFFMNDPVRSIVITEEYGDLGDFAVRLITRARRLSAIANLVWERGLSPRLITPRSLNAEWGKMFWGREWVNDRKVYDRIIELSTDDFGAAWREDSWPELEVQLERLHQLCRKRGAGLVIVIFPVSIQVESNVADDLPQARMKKLAAGEGVPVFDLLPALKGDQRRPVFYDQCHFTPEGADLAAAVIAGFLKEQKLVP